MSELKNYHWKGKNNFILIALVILVLLNFRIIMKNEIINSRVFSVLITNLSWYFLTFFLVLIFRIHGFYKMVFTNESDKFNGYKTIGLKILGGLFELLIMTLLIIIVIAINLYLINSGFLEQSIELLKLSGFKFSKEVPLIFSIMFLFYCLLLETIYLSMVIVKKLFDVNNKIIFSIIFFIMIFIINIFVISNTLNKTVDYSFIAISIVLIKILMLIALWYMLASFLLDEENFSK